MSKAKAARVKNAVEKIVSGIATKMGAFTDAVSEFKILSENIGETFLAFEEAENANKIAMDKLEKDLEEHRKRTLQKAAKEDGRVIITQEQYDDLQAEITRVRSDKNRVLASMEAEVKQSVEREVQNRLKMQELEFNCKTAEIDAKNKSLQSEIKRMTAELESQKRLTGSLAQCALCQLNILKNISFFNHPTMSYISLTQCQLSINCMLNCLLKHPSLMEAN